VSAAQKTIRSDVRVIVTADLGFMGRGNFDAEYSACKEIVRNIHRHVDGIESAAVAYATTRVCSYCDEPVSSGYDGDEPCCCDEAVAEHEATS
jgi:hypothetical protein